MTKRVIVAEDDVLLREGIVRILTEDEYEVVATAGEMNELVSKARAYRPDLVITDLRMPPTSTNEGITAALQIRADLPGTACIVLSQYVDAIGAVELTERGADGIGYLLKQRVMNLNGFLDAVRQVADGGSSIDEDVIHTMVRREVQDHADAAIAQLTPRRLEVLELMAQGHSNARIARELFVSEKAVLRNIYFIFQTLGLPEDSDEHRRVLAVIRYLNGKQ